MQREKIILIGAGSACFTRGIVHDLITRGWECDLCLVDIDPEALAVAEGISRRMIETRQAPVTLHATVDRREVLVDAIEASTMEARPVRFIASYETEEWRGDMRPKKSEAGSEILKRLRSLGYVD